MEESKSITEGQLGKYQKNLDAYILKLGLNPDSCRVNIEPGDKTHHKCRYRFNYSFGGSFISYFYNVTSQGQTRSYIFVDVGIYQFRDIVPHELFNSLMQKKLSIPHPLKISMTADHILTFGFRLPADALTDEYLAELLLALEPHGEDIFKEIMEAPAPEESPFNHQLKI